MKRINKLLIILVLLVVVFPLVSDAGRVSRSALFILNRINNWTAHQVFQSIAVTPTAITDGAVLARPGSYKIAGGSVEVTAIAASLGAECTICTTETGLTVFVVGPISFGNIGGTSGASAYENSNPDACWRGSAISGVSLEWKGRTYGAWSVEAVN